MGKDTDQIKREIEDTRDRMGATADAIGYKADVPSRVRDTIADRIDGVKESITGKVSDVRDGMGETATDLSRRGGRLANAVIENPLGMALAGLALGLLVGNMIPVSDFERERLGPLADQLKDAVVEKGQEAAERGDEVLKQAANAAVSQSPSTSSQMGSPRAGQTAMYTSEQEDHASPAPITE